MIYQFSEAINRNIERTYTYAHIKYKYNGDYESYNPYAYFQEELERNPFQAFMELDGFQFKRTLNTLDRYGIPYTPEQKRKAMVYHDVTNLMQKQRSDTVSMYVENLAKTGIVKLDDAYTLTTEKTIQLAHYMQNLPVYQKTQNIFYESKLPDEIISEPEQYNAIKTILSTKISCLIGGAGVGKSYVTAALINQLKENGRTVAILAPTHKAKESLQEKLTNGTVRTIHSFVHKPDECDVIVIDEAGMLSTPLLHSLLRNYDNQQLIFIGDKNQLPPVEYGRPFELIQERFTTCELTKNKRSEAPDIIAMGREILGFKQNANMRHPNIELVSTAKEAFARGAQVALTFTNQNVSEINQQQRIKNGVPSICSHFKIGEQIIAKTNEPGRYFNGQLFEVISYDLIQNTSTKRIVKINNRLELEYNFTYAYGLTVHKSQGSEWDVVAYQPSEQDTKNIAYVAVTRAKKRLIIIGNGLKDVYPPERKWRQLHETYRL